MKLTRQQKDFLLSYVAEYPETILPRSVDGLSDTAIATLRDTFLANGMSDFDGPATPAEIRIARNLEEKGLLREVTVHGSGCESLYVSFSLDGMQALFDVAITSAPSLDEDIAATPAP